MNRPAVVAVGALLIAAFGSCRFNTARAVAEDSPDPFVRMAEIENKRQVVLDEIERLGPDHPWAGVYHGDGNIGVPFSLVIAPDAGCVTTIFGCFGLRDSRWSSASVSLTHPRSAVDSTDARGHLTAFGETFVLLRDGQNLVLQDERGARYSRQGPEAVLFERAR